MQACPRFRPWHDKVSHRNTLKPTQGKCLHYYFNFIDELFGLCYVRMPIWAPFRQQVYFNGHYWLARQLDKAGLRAHLAELTASRSSYLLKRLRLHGLIKKVGHRHKYYLTNLGRRVVATTLAIREFVLVPSLCNA